MQHIQLAAGQIVQQVLVDGRNLNQVLDESLRRKSVWTPSQRAALQDLSYGTLRFYGQLRAILELLLHKPLSDQRIYYVLLVALYQLEYSKAAQHAVVDHAVRSAQMLNPKISGLVNAILRNFLRSRDTLLEQAKQRAEGKYNYPQWWIDELQTQYGERSEAILEAGNRHPPLTLRVNRRRGTVAEYAASLEREGIAARRIAPDALQLDKPVAVDKLPGFFDGMASVQDAGAQYAALLLDAHDGMRVLDACAAPGGKAVILAERLDGRGSLTTLDPHEDRLVRLRENLRRLGLPWVAVVRGDATSVDAAAFQRADPPAPGEFDAILLDVPCSNTGVIRRRPDARWSFTPQRVERLVHTQAALLDRAATLLRPGGRIVYSTCSLEREENGDAVRSFLARAPGFTLVSERVLFPPDTATDGAYAALLAAPRKAPEIQGSKKAGRGKAEG